MTAMSSNPIKEEFFDEVVVPMPKEMKNILKAFRFGFPPKQDQVKFRYLKHAPHFVVSAELA